MRLEDHFGSGSMLQRNERVKLAASFWNNIGAGMVIGGMAAAFFLEPIREVSIHDEELATRRCSMMRIMAR